MTIGFQQHLTEDRRLCILRLLSESGGSANDSILHQGLELLGHRNKTRDDIRADIRFLKDAGCVIDDWLSHVQVVTITRRGVEAAQGRVVIEGIKKPSIGA